MQIIAFVKEHPVPVGIGVVLLLLIVMTRGGSSSSGSTGGGANYAAQAQSNLQMSAMASQSAIALGAQDVQKNQIASDAATSRMGIAGSLLASFASLGASTDANRSNNTLKVIQSTQTMQIQKEALANDLDIKSQSINAGVRMNSDSLSAQLTALVTDNNFKLSEIGANTQGNLALMQGQAAIYKDTLPALMAHETEMARILGSNALALLTRSTEADVVKANSDADTAATKGQQQWAENANNGVHSWFKLGSYI